MSTVIAHRLVIPVQRRGNLGKSTVMELLAQFYEQHAVAWRGFDLDPDHRSLVRRFPAETTLVELGDEPEGDLLKVFRECHVSPVTLIDPRAHLSDTLLRTWEIIQFPTFFASQHGRVSVLLFLADDLETMSDVDATVAHLGDTVDYIVIKNRARAPRTRMFDGSELAAELQRLGSVELEIPVLLSLARNRLAALDAEHGRGITALEAVSRREVLPDPLIRMVLEDWLKAVFRQCERLAPVLLPSALAAQITQVDTAPSIGCPTRRGAKLNLSNL